MKQLLVDLGPKLYMNCVPNGIIMEQFQPSMIDEDLLVLIYRKQVDFL